MFRKLLMLWRKNVLRWLQLRRDMLRLQLLHRAMLSMLQLVKWTNWSIVFMADVVSEAKLYTPGSGAGLSTRPGVFVCVIFFLKEFGNSLRIVLR